MIGVSPDSAAKHQKFKAKYGLTYALVADTEHTVAEQYGVWGEKSMFGRKYMGVKRTTFVIDRAGKIAHVFEDVSPPGHAAEVADVVSRVS